MGIVLRLAWRNLWRHKRRTWLTASAIAFVTVLMVREYKYADDPTKSYTTTWFDTWRFVDGKADEHWDPATIAPPASPERC